MESVPRFPRRSAETRGQRARGSRTLGSEDTEHECWEEDTAWESGVHGNLLLCDYLLHCK